MIGVQRENNDIFIFIEDGEMSKLETETLSGDFIDHKKVDIVTLYIDSVKCRKKGGMVNLTYLGNILAVAMIENGYSKLKTKGSYCPHLGYAHVNIIDTGQSTYNEMMFYESLKRVRDKS